ncbi:MAG: ATP-binding protein [Pseudomonadota bacterium]|uniref:ATP-binding protein n=1 Tax=Candidatus Desulfatibia profunda TaxID=2841695 RepID=A0A8J6TMN7_9BACT|nr:ATP-binding protein [Candidatus Desulfatibia profunda]MBL7180513.1 ATP-binding protein [Desulfobacterales bacterium]
MKKLKRAVGNYVTGEKFWDREKDIELFKDLLDEGAHILVAAPRRIGKTSLMREVANRVQDRYYCLHVDLQKAESPADAVAELSKATHPYKQLWEKTKGIFKNILSGLKDNIESLGIDDLTVTLRSGLTAGDWQDKGDQLFLTLAETDKPVVIFFDEFPILVNRLLKGKEFRITPERREATDVFMSWVRDNSIRHQGKVRIVITGSIGIEPALRQADLSASLNTFMPFVLPVWSDEIAKGCLEALANQYEIALSPEAVNMIIEKLGYLIPHHVQLFFDNIYMDCKRRDYKKVTENHVTEIYETKMLSIQGHAELSHLEERLKMAFGLEIYPIALEILTEAAVRGYLDGKSALAICQSYEIAEADPNKILREILEILQHDGYLAQDDERFVFVSRLLKDWWKARFAFGYIPIFERRV